MVSYYSGLTQKHGWLVCRVLPCLLALKTRSRCRSLSLFIFHLLRMFVLLGFCGDKFSVVLNQGNRLKYFNILMGAFLILSALLILIDFLNWSYYTVKI